MKAKRILVWTSIMLLVVMILGHYLLPPYLDGDVNTVVAHSDYKISDKANQLHQTLVIGDLHADTAFWQRDLFHRNEPAHLDIPRMREGNMPVQMFTTFTKVPTGIDYVTNSSETRDRLTPLIVLQAWPIANSQ